MGIKILSSSASKIRICILFLLPSLCLASDFITSAKHEYSEIENQSLPFAIDVNHYLSIETALDDYCRYAKLDAKKYTKIKPEDCKKNSRIIFDEKDDGYWILIRTNKYNSLSGADYLIDKTSNMIIKRDYSM